MHDENTNQHMTDNVQWTIMIYGINILGLISSGLLLCSELNVRWVFVRWAYFAKRRPANRLVQPGR